MIVNLLLICTLILLILYLLVNKYSNFINSKTNSDTNNSNTNNIDTDNSDTNNKIKQVNINIKTDQEQIKNLEQKKTYMSWNPNNTIESMVLEPCLENVKNTNRMTCYTAPLWWYPKDKYDPDNFKSNFYGDNFNPIYNYLGNVQNTFWDFKSVTDN